MAAHHPVVPEQAVDQGLDRARVADFLEYPSDILSERAVGEGPYKAGDRPGVSDPLQGPNSRGPNGPVSILEGLDQRLDRPWSFRLPEPRSCLLRHGPSLTVIRFSEAPYR